MKRFLLAALGALAVASLNGCYASPYSYGATYGAPAYYSAPAYNTPGYYNAPGYYSAPTYRTGYVAPAYRPAGRVYVAPPRPGYRTTVVHAPRYGRSW